MQVAKWGNSLAVRLPAAVVQALDLKPGGEVFFMQNGQFVEGQLTIRNPF